MSEVRPEKNEKSIVYLVNMTTSGTTSMNTVLQHKDVCMFVYGGGGGAINKKRNERRKGDRNIQIDWKALTRDSHSNTLSLYTSTNSINSSYNFSNP